MAYFAKVQDGKVVQVIVADASFFNSFVDSSPGAWLETKQDGSLRKNYAGIGFSYDAQRDAFIAPKPFPSWTLDEASCRWEAPVAMPNDGKMYAWNEQAQEWDLIAGQ